MKKQSPKPNSGQPAVHEATGPRTTQGKKRSRFNALKHGLYSKFIPLEGDLVAEYRSLLNGLWDYWQPQGKQESVEVENLAALYWRMRRFFQAENAEISEKIDCTPLDYLQKQGVEAFEVSRNPIAFGGLLRHAFNPLLVREAQEGLRLLKMGIATVGFTEDSPLLKKLYGDDRAGEILSGFPLMFETYAIQARLAKTDDDRTRDAERRKIMIEGIDAQIDHLAEVEELLKIHDRQRIEWKSSAAVVPSQEGSDRLMRNETHLGREIDRVVNRLVRLQRIRKWQPLPPQEDVKIS